MSKSTLEKDKGKHDYATKTHEGFFFFFFLQLWGYGNALSFRNDVRVLGNDPNTLPSQHNTAAWFFRV